MIHIITTGGTIEGLEYDKVEDKPSLNNKLIENFLETANVNFNYILERVLQKDSRFITSNDRKILGEKIESSKFDKILVTHGTLTMIETAKFLGQLDIDKVIVMVGSFILGTKNNTDAPFNLGYALCALQTLDKGVYIAMNGNMISWENVFKNSSTGQFEYIEA